MNYNIDFLNYVYENARMGVVSINQLIDSIRNEEFICVLKHELEEYQIICDEAIKLFIKYKKEEKDIPGMVKIMSYLQIKMTKKSSMSKIAKMMIEGSTKGIIEITEKINCYPSASEEIIKLAKKLLKTEQNNIEGLKKYL